MRPLRSFFIILIFLVFFIGLHYVAPVSKWFPSAEEFIPACITHLVIPETEKPDTIHEVLQDKSGSHHEITTDTGHIPDSLVTLPDSIPVNPLQKFYDSLDRPGGQTRILYYGDSQIEGDRFTSYLRHILQQKYEGKGPGLFLPLMPVMYTKSIVLKASSNWRKYNYLSYKKKELSHNELGPFMAICRFLPEGEKTSDPVTAWVNIKPSSFADSTSSAYDLLRLFYISREGPVVFSIIANGKYICREALLKTGSLSEVSCRLNGAKDITLEFTGNYSPDIYGISIESESGVIVDNLPQRGSAGLEFTMIDSANLARSFRLLSPDLIVLQYGLNIVRNIREEYKYYQFGLERQITLLNQIAPSVPVLVISVTDMASEDEGVKKSFSNIPAIIEAQKKATEETGAVFWNSYTAMGGESSIIRWSGMKPALAQKDFVHFTYPGADTLARILAKDIFTDRNPQTQPSASSVQAQGGLIDTSSFSKSPPGGPDRYRDRG